MLLFSTFSFDAILVVGMAIVIENVIRIGAGGSCPYHPSNTPPGEDFFLINCTKDACKDTPASFVQRVER